MKSRDIWAVVLGIAALGTYFLVAAGAVPMPGVAYLNVRATAGVDCGVLWTCWFDNQLTVDYMRSFEYGAFPMAAYCGFGAEPLPLRIVLETTAPSGAESRYEHLGNICDGKDVTASWNVPLKESGTHLFLVEACGLDAMSRPGCQYRHFSYTLTAG